MHDIASPRRTAAVRSVATGASRWMPRLSAWDSTFALLADPYRFIGRQCRQHGTDVFETRLMLRRTICLTGAPAAALFYDPELFQRAGAAPEPLQATLFGKGAVQSLDGASHRMRKTLFIRVTGAEQVSALVADVRREWNAALPQWLGRGPIPLYRAIQPPLTVAVCRWAGVPLTEAEVPRRTAQLTALFDSAASGFWNHVSSRLARIRAERWLARLVRETRSGRERFAPGSPAEWFVWHRDEHGQLLTPRVTAVELLNLLRPTVAVSVYIAFIAHALHAYPAWRETLAADDRGAALAFVQEVRRHYPFFPAIAARVRRTFEWQGKLFPAGVRAMLDLYGTNHDPRTWREPMAFLPERWQGMAPGRFEFIPQGGADVATHHRCPGEDVATQLMLLSLDFLIHRMRYRVDARSREILMNRLPAVPRSGLLMRDLSLAG
jgi:fatty-acid peroxygenase